MGVFRQVVNLMDLFPVFNNLSFEGKFKIATFMNIRD